MLVCLLTWNEQGVHFHQPTARRCIEACPSIFLRKGLPKEFSEFGRVNWIPPCQNHQLKTQLKSCKNYLLNSCSSKQFTFNFARR